jgi:hypothetical protein
MIALLFLLQAIEGVGAGQPSPLRPPDLGQPLGPEINDRGCAPGPEGSILVCRRRDSVYRLPPIFAPRGMTLPGDGLARVGLGNGAEATADLTQQVRPDGFVDRRFMIHFKIPF